MARTFEVCDRRVSSSCGPKQLFLSALLTVPLVVLVACGRKQPSRINHLNLAVTGQTITKVRTAAGHVVLLQEKLVSIFEDGPDRTISILQTDGHTLHSYTAPPGWSVVDFAVHPSGDISVILTTATDVRIVRLDRQGAIRSDEPFLDPLSPTDPYFNYAGGIKNDLALQPALMHDAARLAPLGESLAVVLRTGRNAIVAYRLDPDASGAYTQSWRTLVEPGYSIFLLGITSGSFDVFGELQNHIRFFIDADSSVLAIGLVNSPTRNFTFQAHSEFFNDPIAASDGVLLTRVSVGDGHLLGSTAIDTRNLAELHGLRISPRGFMLVGRVLSQIRSDGSGWDAFAATVESDGSPGPYSVIDVDRGDVLFDVAPLASGRYIALGSSGYTQNPSGESISESAQPLLALLNSDGSVAKRLDYTSGPRQNQLNSIAPLNGDWILSGMVNGPGTHSGDADHNLIKADGFLRDGSDLPTK
jgi:hypothetical protein